MHSNSICHYDSSKPAIAPTYLRMSVRRPRNSELTKSRNNLRWNRYHRASSTQTHNIAIPVPTQHARLLASPMPHLASHRRDYTHPHTPIQGRGIAPNHLVPARHARYRRSIAHPRTERKPRGALASPALPPPRHISGPKAPRRALRPRSGDDPQLGGPAWNRHASRVIENREISGTWVGKRMEDVGFGRQVGPAKQLYHRERRRCQSLALSHPCSTSTCRSNLGISLSQASSSALE